MSINVTESVIFADDPKDYQPGSERREELVARGGYDEEAYDAGDFAADTEAAYGTDEADSAGVGELADPSAGGEPDSSAGQGGSSHSDELEEYERGDPT